MSTNYINNNEGINSRSSESANSSKSAELLGTDSIPHFSGHSLVNKLLTIKTVSAKMTEAVQATNNLTEKVEALAAKLESR
jgi:hypothetical protein